MARPGNWLSRKRAAAPQKPAAPADQAIRPSGALALERRIAFDAALVETVQAAVGPAEIADSAASNDLTAADTSSVAAPDKSGAVTDTQPFSVPHTDAISAMETGRNEIIFIDSRVTDVATLIRGLNNPGAEVVLLDANRDGVQQIADALAGRTDINTIHVLSHGSEADLLLGTSNLTAETINGRYAGLLASIGQSLSADADILIYGCDFGKGEDGKLAAELLAAKTGADVAASIDPTGNAALGGDWVLERVVGDVDASRELSATDWQGLLAATTINPTGGVLASGADGLKILVTDLGQTQVTYQNQNQFYQSGTVTDNSTNLFNGVYLAVGTQVIGPDTGAENITKVAWKSVAAQTLTGTGSAADPYVVTTKMYYDQNGNSAYDAATDTQMEVKTIYISGTKYTTQAVTITPPATNTNVIKFYHGIDTFLAGGDNGPAFSLNPDLAVNNVTTGDPSLVGVRKAVGTSTESIVGFVELDGGAQFSRYYSATWNAILNGIASGGDIVNTWNTNPATDNGIGVQFTLGAITAPTTFSYYLAFDGDTKLDLDANNSTAAGTGYIGSYSAQTGALVGVVDSDIQITNVIGDIADATVTLTNPQAGDVLFIDPSLLPAGITVEARAASTITISGIANETDYQNALKLIKFSTTDGSTTNRLLNISVRNQLNSVVTSATSTLMIQFSPVVDLNSGVNAAPTTNNIVTNAGFQDYADLPTGWSESGTGIATDSAITGRYGFTATAADTLTKVGLTGLNVGPSPQGAGQITLDLGYVNTGTDRVLAITIGGVTYATLDTTTNQVTYTNGATNAVGTTAATSITAMATATSALTAITINLPSTVVSSGDLAFVTTSGVDDIYIDNVKVRTTTTAFVDATAGNDYSTTFAQGGSSVAIASPAADVRDGDSASMTSGIIALTNAQTGDRLRVGGSTASSGTVLGLSYTNTGTQITLTGSASKATYAAAIRTITFEHTIGSPATGVVRDVTVTVNDGTYGSNAAHSYITVLDSVPALDLDLDDSSTFGTSYTTTFSEGSTAVSIADTDATIVDSLSLTIASATVTLTNQQTSDRLLVNGSAAASGTFASGIGWTRTDTTVVLSGVYTKAQYIAALKLIQFENTSDAPSTTPRVISTFVSNGSANSNAVITIVNVSPANDAPVNTLPASWTTNEDTNLTLTGLSISDIDAGTSDVTVTLSVATGAITASSGGGITVGGSGTSAVTLTGTVANINSFLANAGTQPVYVPVANANGTVVLTMTTNDGGNTGTGGALTDIDTRNIAITAINDAPVNTLPGAFAAETSTSIYLIGLSVADADAGGANVTVTISVPASSGVFNISTSVSGGLTAPQVSGNGTRTLVLTAPVSAINATLASVTGLQYTAPGSAGGYTLTILTSDGGNTGAGGTLTDTDTATITITAVSAANDAPVNYLPTAAWVATEDVPLALAGITITDIDIGAGSATVTLSVTTGRLNVSTSVAGGLTAVQVSGNNSGTITINAPLSAINTTLANATALVFTPALDSTTSVTFTIVTNDNGGSGTGGAKSDSDTKTITITAVNDAPTLSTSSTASFTESGAAVAISTALVVADVDSAALSSAAVTITNFIFGQDALNFTNVSATMGNVAGSYNALTGVMTLTSAGSTATVAQWQAALRAITYQNTSESPDVTTRNVRFTITDPSGAVSAGLVSQVQVTAVNDQPTNTVPGAQSVSEDAALSFSVAASNAITVSDIDIGSSNFTTVVSVPAGHTLTAVTGGGAVITGNGTNSVSITGSKTQVDAALNGLTYVPLADFNGVVTLTMLTSDNGGTGSGGILTDTDTVTITVTAVNDAPVVAVPIPDQNVNEDTAWSYVVPLGSFTDVDSTLTWSATLDTGAVLPTWLTFNATTRTFSGTPPLNFNGTVGLRVTVTDGVASPVSDDFVLTVNPVNDAPVVAVPVPDQTVNEDTAWTYVVPLGSFTDVDSTLTWSATLDTGAVLPTWLTFNATTRTFSGTPSLNFNGTIGLRVTVTDGVASPVSDDFVLTVNPVNDAPVVAIPVPDQTVNEDTAWSYVVPLGSFTDVDSTLTWSATLDTGAVLPSWLTFNATTRTFSGTPPLNFNGTIGLRVTVTDGVASPVSDDLVLTVNAVNDAPVNTLPATGWTTNEDTNVSLSGLSISDVDAASGSVTVTLSVASGTLTASAAGAVTVSGSGSGSIVLTGSVSAINTYLGTAAQQPVYVPVANANGTVVLTMTTDDGGNTGTGGALTDVDTRNITITAANDAPVVAIPVPDQSVNEDTAWSYVVPLGSFTDVDSSLTWSATLDTGAALPTWLSFNATTRTFSGTPPLNFNGTVGLRVTVTDGVASPVSDDFVLTVNPVNDAPVGNADTGIGTEDTVLSVAAASGLLINDSDVEGNPLSVTQFTVAGIAGNKPLGSAIDIPNVGALTIYSNGSYVFEPASNFTGAAPLITYTISDGQGGLATATLTITTTAVNDAPVVNLGAGTNLLVNGGFDTPTMSNFNTNNIIGPSWGGWTAIGGNINVLQVNGSAYASGADVANTGTQYIDIDAPGTLVQSFTLTDTVTIQFGAAFNHRELAAATNGVDIRDAGGSLVATTGNLDFRTTSGNELWMPATGFVTLGPGTYSINIRLGDNAHVDSAFVRVTGHEATFTENGTAASIAATGLSLADPDNATLQSATITLTDRQAGDQLTIGTLPGGISASAYNPATGIVTLSGSASLASYRTAIQAIAFSNTLDTPSTADRHVSVTVNDGALVSNAAISIIHVTAINDAPVNTVPGAQTINEDTSRIFSVANGNAITVSDVDIGAGNFTTVVSVPAGEGLLTAITGGGAVITGNTTNSVSITGTKAQVDAALNGLSYVPTANLNGSVILTVQTSDNGGTGTGGTLTDTDTITINITPINDAPVLAAAIPDQTINEDQTFNYIVPAGTFTDVDNASLTWTATLSDNSPLPSWVSFNGITRTFTGTPPANFHGAIDFKVTGSDGALSASDTFTLTILPVNDAPDGADKTATFAEDAIYTFIAADFGFSDTSDTPANTLQSVIITTLPPAGEGVLKLAGIAVTAGQEISLANLGSLTFTPVTNLNGTNLGSFTFQVRDDGGTANAGVNLDPVANTFRFNITPVNDAPVLAAPIPDQNVNEDTAWSYIVPLGSFTDVDSTLAWSATLNTGAALPAWLSFNATTRTFSGTPPLNFNGTIGLRVTVTDGVAPAVSDDFVLTVNPVNDAPTSPIAIANQASLDGAAVSLNVSGNFADVDGDALTFSATSLPAGLSINPTTGVISGTIDRNASVTGTYNVAVQAMDPSGTSVTRNFTYTVTNPAPTPANDAFTTAEDTGLTGNLLADNGAGPDIDPDGDALTVAVLPVTPPSHGTVTISPDGSFSYTPAANYYGTDSFVYSVTDANGATATATASITITPVNDAPVPPVSISSQTNNDGETITPVNLATGWSDIEGDTLTFSATGLPPGLSIAANGTVTGTLTSSASTGDGSNDGVRTYSVTLMATDSNGAATSRILTWTVSNLPPDARDDAATTNESTPITGLNVITDAGAGRDVDPDDDTTLTVVAVNGLTGGVGGSINGSSGGLFTINADGSASFNPGADFIDVPAGGTRTTSVQYTISDGQGGTDTATLTVTVTGINQAPVATPIGDKASLDGAAITTNIAAFFSDIDADALTFSISAGQLPLGLTLNATTGQISGTINNQASQGGNVPGQPGLYSITIRATDTSGAIANTTFTWSVSNPAPTAVNDGPLAWVEDSGTLSNINVLSNDTDPDGDPLIVVSATAAKGTVTINANGTLNYTPTANYNGTDTIIYQISDGNGGVSTASVTIVVADDFADPPILIDPNALPTLNNLDQDTVSMPVNGFFVRGDNPIVSFVVNGQLPPGITFNATTGTLEGTLDANASAGAWPLGNAQGVYELSISAVDSGGLSVTQNIRWEITNPLPTANPDSATVSENGSVAIDVLANDTDPDGELSNSNPSDRDDLVVSTAAAGHGTVTINANGTLQYMPDADFNGTDTITYTLSDGNGGFSTSSVTVTVNPVNDAPEFAPGVTSLPTRASTDSTLIAVDLAPFFRDVDLDPAIVQTRQGDVLTYTLSNGALPAGLTLSADGKITGTITSGASGPTGTHIYTAEITVADGKGGTVTTSFAWTVANILPVAVDDSFSTLEDTPIFVALTGAGSLAANDGDPDGDAFVVQSVNGTSIRNGLGALIDGLSVATAHGVFTVDAANNRLAYQPTANFHGLDTAIYTIRDVNGGSATAAITLNIISVNDVPVATADSVTTNEDTPVTIDVIKAVAAPGTPGQDTDADGDPLTIISASVSPAQGAVSIVGNQLLFTPAANFNGTATISYTISDGQGGTATAQVTVTVDPVNDAPVAQNDAVTMAEDTAVTINPRINDSDVDGDSFIISQINGQAVTTGVPVSVTNGSVTLNGAGNLVFTPDADYNGPASFTYAVLDSNGATSAPATISITVTAVNDAPVAQADALGTTENAMLSGSVLASNGFGADSDVDGDTLSVAAVNGDAFSVGQPVTGSAGGTFSIAATGAYSFDPGTAFDDLAPGETRITTIQYTVSDGHGGTSIATVTVTATGQNDAPIIIDPTTGLPSATPGSAVPVQTVTDNTVITPLNISGYFRDPDTSQSLTLSIPNGLLPSGISFNAATGTFSGTPSADASQGNTSGQPIGTYVIPVTATDPSGATVTTNIRFVISNPAPVAGNDSTTTAEDTAVSGSVTGNDSDPDGDTLTWSVVSGPAHGVFVLGTNGSYAYTPDADYNGADSFTYQVSDGQGGITTATVGLTITPVNDAPVVTAPAAQTMAEDSPLTFSVANGNALVVTDVDSATTLVTTLSVSSGTLNIASFAGLSVIGNGSGFVTLTGTPTAINAALNGLIYTSVADVPGSVTLSIGSNDGAVTTSASVAITVNPVADIVADTASTNEDAAVVLDLLANDSFENPGRAITAINGSALVLGTPVALANGSVALNADGTVTFAPVANYHGPANFSYTVTSNGVTETAMVALTVVSANDVPVVTNTTATTDEDTPVILPARANATDSDGNTLTIVATGPNAPSASHGTISINPDGTLTYVPDANYHGADIVTYAVSDGNGGLTTATISVTVNSVNDAPVVTSTTASTSEDTPVTLPALANATDVDGDTLTIVATGPNAPSASHGTVSINPDGTLTYAPDANYHGADTVTYAVIDGNGGLTTVTISVTVNSVNDAPVVTSTTATTDEDSPVILPALANATDVDGDTLTIVATGPNAPSATNGSVTINPDGTLRYVPNPNFHGSDIVTYTVSDGNGGLTTATISVTVNSVNDAPVAIRDSATTNEDTPVTIAVRGNDSDADGEALFVDTVNGMAIAIGSPVTIANGLVSMTAGGDLIFTPSANYHGPASFTYTVKDPTGASSVPVTVSITVISVNDGPVANTDTVTTDEGTPLNIAVLANDTDADGDTLTIVAIGPQAPGASHGTVSINPDGTLRYRPDPHFNGSDTITYTVSDGNGGFSTATVSVTVNAVNDAPSAQNDNAATDEETPVIISVLANDNDIDGDTLTVTSASAGNGIVVVNPDGTVTYTPDLNFFGLDTITYQISDGHGGTANATVTVSVAPVNDPPIVGPVGNRNNTDGQGVAINMAAAFADPEGQALVFSAGGLPAGLSINSVTGVISGSIASSASQGGNDPGQPGVYTVTVTATDPQGASSTTIFTWAVTNLAPVAVSDTATTDEDTGVTITPLVNDRDPDGDAITIVAAVAGRGTVVINGDGTVRYQPNPDFFGTDTIVYTIRDADGLQSTAQITVTIDPVNDLPVAIDPLPNRSSLDGQIPAVSFASLFSDPEGGVLTFAATGLPGGLGLNPTTGEITGSIAPGASAINGGVYTVTLTATDIDGGSITRTFNWTIANVGPAAAPDVATTPEEQPFIVTVLANDLDDDGDPLTVVSASIDPLQGSVTINADGTLTFTPAPNFNGLAVVTYSIADDGGLRSTATVSITVTPVNDAPVIAPLPSISTADGAAVLFDLSSFFSDIDQGQILTVSYSGLPAGLTFDSTGAISGTVSHDASQGGSAGVYSVTATVTDGNGGLTQRTFTMIVGNVTPIAADDTASTDEDTPLVVDLLKLTAANGTPGKDVDPDGDTLSISSATASNGAVTVNPDGTVLYTPAPGFFGTDVITYTISDGNGGFSTASATITVQPINDPPVARPDTAITNEDQPVTFAVLANDTDPENNPLSVVAASVLPTQGSVSINPDGTLTFTPSLDFNGTATITYRISDGNGGTATSTVMVTVLAQPEAPRPLPDVATTAEDTAVTISILANDADPDGGPLRVTAVTVDPAQGQATINADGTITFAPAANFNGVAVITYQITDDTGLTSTATATVSVTPVNDAPVATGDTATVAAGGSITLNPLANDGDIDGQPLSITAIDGQPIVPGSTVTLPSGRVTLNPDGTLTFIPNPGYSGSISFIYTISDGAGGTASASIALTITPEIAPATTSNQQPNDVPTGAPVVGSFVFASDQPIPSIATESVILEAVSQYGGLDGYTQSLALERPLLTAVNGVDRLDTGMELGRSGRIVDPAALGAFPRDDLSGISHRNGFDHAQTMVLLQRQFTGASQQDFDSAGAVVSGLIDSRQLVLTFLNKDLSAIGRDGLSGIVVVVTLPDGTQLPEWLHWTDKGQLTGIPPEGEESITILVQTRTSDGHTVSRTLIVNLRDGTAAPLTIRKQVMDEVPSLFSRQLQLAMDHGGNDSPLGTSLADMIRRAS